MNLLEKLKTIDKSKIKDKEVVKELEIAIENYDEKVPESMSNAEMILEIVKETFPDALGVNETKKSEVKQVKEPEKKEDYEGNEEVKKTIKNKKKIKEKVKKDPDLKVEEVDKSKKFTITEEIKKKILGKGEKLVKFKPRNLEYTEEEAIEELTKRKMSKNKSKESKEMERKDGTGFKRSYLNDEEAYQKLIKGKPVFGKAKGGTIYLVKSMAELMQSFKDGLNLFIEENIENHVSKPKQMVEKENHPVSKEPEEKPSRKTITKENKEECAVILSEIRKLLDEHRSAKTKTTNTPAPKKKALSVIVKDGVVHIMKRVINREKNSKKKIDVEKFNAAIKKGKEFLMALRRASGGISDENDQMIKSFEKQMKELVEQDKKAA
jgi:hypothetical protein